MAAKRNANGNGSIFFDESRGKWRAQIQWTDRNGERHIKKFVGAKKTEVKNRLDEFKKQLLISSGDFSNGSVSFQDFATTWLESSLKQKLKPSSYMRKETTLRHQVFPLIGNIAIDQLTHTDVQNMINELSKQGLSYSTIKKAYEAVNGCMREYRIKTSSTLNPCEGISLPTASQRDIADITFFNEEQRALICNEATRVYSNNKPVYRLGHSIIVLMYTGMRIGELLALKWSDVDFDNRTISISKNAVVSRIDVNGESKYKLINQTSTKTKSGRRIIPLSGIAHNSLYELYKINGDKDYVMCTSTGQQSTPRNISRMFYGILKKAGIADDETSCGLHTLRHTFASMLFMNGCDVKIVSELLGHSDTKITENIYIHLLQEQKIKAIQSIDRFIE